MDKFSTEEEKVKFLNENLDRREAIIKKGEVPPDAKDKLLDNRKNVEESDLLLVNKQQLIERINSLITMIEG